MDFVAPEAKVLVVDDSTVNLNMFCGLMRATQAKTAAVKSGPDAIKILQSHEFDIIFLDHMMPDMDGVETFTKLREENLIGDTPVIMLTANAEDGSREHFLEIGFQDFLAKPIDINELERILKTYVKAD